MEAPDQHKRSKFNPKYEKLEKRIVEFLRRAREARERRPHADYQRSGQSKKAGLTVLNSLYCVWLSPVSTPFGVWIKATEVF